MVVLVATPKCRPWQEALETAKIGKPNGCMEEMQERQSLWLLATASVREGFYELQHGNLTGPRLSHLLRPSKHYLSRRMAHAAVAL